MLSKNRTLQLNLLHSNALIIKCTVLKEHLEARSILKQGGGFRSLGMGRRKRRELIQNINASCIALQLHFREKKELEILSACRH